MVCQYPSTRVPANPNFVGLIFWGMGLSEIHSLNFPVRIVWGSKRTGAIVSADQDMQTLGLASVLSSQCCFSCLQAWEVLLTLETTHSKLETTHVPTAFSIKLFGLPLGTAQHEFYLACLVCLSEFSLVSRHSTS